MPARPRLNLRSHPGRVAAVTVAVLLASGAVVAAVTGGSVGSGRAGKSLSSNASRSVAPSVANSSDSFAYDGSTPTTTVPMYAGGGGVPGSASVPLSSSEQAAGRVNGATTPTGEAPVSPGVGPSGLGGQPVPGAVASGTTRIVKNASLSVNVKKGSLGDSYQRAVDAAAGVGGWVQGSQTGTDQATLTLKVPSDKLEGVIGAIRGLGKVTSVSESGEDVTAEFIDLEARIGHWRAQEAVFVVDRKSVV